MMKIIMSLMFSFMVLGLNMNKLYMIIFMLNFLIFLKMNLFEGVLVENYLMFSLDLYSFYLISLSFWVIGLMLLIQNNMKLSGFNILVLLLILVSSFSTFNMLMFYFMFEASLLPIFLLIKFDGYSFERIEAIMYMYFFTMISSMPFLVFVVKVLNESFTLNYFIMEILKVKVSEFLLILMLMVFLVKMPMFMVHIWLPKAHVEAPVYGSMILAGVLLKLGGFGILRLGFMFMNMKNLSDWLIAISLIGGGVLSLVCLIQVDLKMLVAYSSVVHMGMVVASLMTLSKVGVLGSYLMMIGHGVCSSGMFYIVNVSYERVFSRLIFLNKGMMNLNSMLSLWWFFLCIGNFSAPISLSLVGELMMMMSLISFDYSIMIHLSLMSFLSAAYSLYLFSFTQHGGLSGLMMNFKNIMLKEYLILFMHIVPLNLLVFIMNLF